MAVKIKLKRLGKVHAPQYRIVIADSRTARNGRAIEEIGVYQPMEDPSVIRVDSERVQYWLGVGAQPTEAVAAILKVTGDWQRFKGLPGAEGTLRVAEPKPSKTIAFEAAVKAAAEAPAKPVAPKQPKLAAVEVAAVVADAPVDQAPADETPAEIAELVAAEVAEEAAEAADIAAEQAIDNVVADEAAAEVLAHDAEAVSDAEAQA